MLIGCQRTHKRETYCFEIFMGIKSNGGWFEIKSIEMISVC